VVAAAGLEVDSKDPTPLHAQIERAIRVAIATGRLAAGAQLPTVRQLAVDLRVNANTVAKVYAHLEREGTLETRRGVGTFVSGAHDETRNQDARRAELRALAQRALADASSRGFSAEEFVRDVHSLLKEHHRGEEN
jgi:GntR family transcriptional regulator